MTARSKPPFRADMVGSLLRSAAVKEAREKKSAGQISAAELSAIEDREIAALVKKQEAVGLKASRTASSAAPSGISTSSRTSPASSARSKRASPSRA